MAGAVKTGMYTNLFAEAGYGGEEIRARLEEILQEFFFDEEKKFYFVEGDLAYIMDTGNNDVRTEGMSYAMMMFVQLGMKEDFDRVWRWTMKYMYMTEGENRGYFAWSCAADGTRNSQGPAPDGEEYFALALFFASARWGDGAVPFNYSEQARDILRHCLHQHEMVESGEPMWEPSNHLIKFVPSSPFSDPSYHLPHFYEIFAQCADKADHGFWIKAAKASREYIALSCHPVTGMAPEYAEYDGTPRLMFNKKPEFYSDAYRVVMNIGLDAAWCGKTPALTHVADRLQAWFSENTNLGDYDSYLLDGTPVDLPALHPTAIIATNAAASLAAEGKYRLQWVRDFWNTPLRRGHRRYYDNCLYFFCLLMLAGEYKIFTPPAF
jgi:oligosaccharide reducing-end xylanase